MLTKIKDGLAKLLQAVPDKITSGNMRVYYGAIIGFVFLYLLFVAGWLWNFRIDGRADLAILISFAGVYFGSYALAFITTISRKIVDKDGNGISDADEEEKDEIKN